MSASADASDEAADEVAGGPMPRRSLARQARLADQVRHAGSQPKIGAAQGREGQADRRPPGFARRTGRLLHRRRQKGRRDQPLQGSRRDESRTALGDHDGSGSAHAAAGPRRRSHGSRPDVHDADGRPGGAAPQVHRRQRAGCQEPRCVGLRLLGVPASPSAAFQCPWPRALRP